MRAFEIHPPKPSAPPPKPARPRRRYRRLALAAAFLLLLGGAYRAARPNPHAARVKQLRQELFADRGKGPSTPERKAKFDEFRQEMAQLSADQKAALFEPMRQQAKERFEKYFALSPAEQRKYLDETIDRSEKARKDREKKGGGAAGPGLGGPPGFGGGPGKQPPNPDQIEERKKKMLDRTTADERAKMDRFRHDLEARRKQRGLPAAGGRVGPFGR